MRALLGVALTIWVFLNGPALAEKRVALVIGNSAYKHVPRLQNPGNDAAAVVRMFQTAGFDAVDSRLDLGVNEMRRALREFGAKTRDADVAVIYYAGHGIELDGSNFLIPIDAMLETDTDVFDETLALDRVLIAVEPAKQLRLVILDACRDNPFAKIMKRTLGTRGIGRGLAKIEPSSPNTMIAFAAKAGSTASDGDTNSPFSKALINHLARPGLDLRKAFGFVRDDVLKATNNAQEPFIYGSLGGNDVSLVPAASTPTANAPVADQDATMRRDYEFADRIGTKSVWDAFIEKYSSGFYTTLARAQRDKLVAETARLEATNKVKAAQEEQTRLANEGAKSTEQGKVAENVRVAAELAKKREEAKIVADAKADKREKGEKLAALTPTGAALSPTEIITSVQFELRKAGCLTAMPTGDWNAASQRSLALFNKYAGTKLSESLIGADTLDAIKTRTDRVCPLACDHGFKPDGDRCTKITCRAGYEVGDSNTCEKIEVRKPAARRDEPKRERQERAKTEAASQTSGQVFCNYQGCRPLRKGCRIQNSRNPTGTSTTNQFEVCD